MRLCARIIRGRARQSIRAHQRVRGPLSVAIRDRRARLHAGTRDRRAPGDRFFACGPAHHPYDTQDALSPRMLRVIQELAGEWRRLDRRINGQSGEIEALARQDQACSRLMTVPGIGPAFRAPWWPRSVTSARAQPELGPGRSEPYCRSSLLEGVLHKTTRHAVDLAELRRAGVLLHRKSAAKNPPWSLGEVGPRPPPTSEHQRRLFGSRRE